MQNHLCIDSKSIDILAVSYFLESKNEKIIYGNHGPRRLGKVRRSHK